MSRQLTLYSSKTCPYSHRVEIALAEATADYTLYEIDLDHKPDWYMRLINAAGKVPCITYGGPRVPADQPSLEARKIPESIVLLEFVADLYPEARLMPMDPVQRAEVRLFIDAVGSKLVPTFFGSLYKGESPETILPAIEAIQRLLPPDTKYAVADGFSIADAAIVTFLARFELMLSNDLGMYPRGEGKKVYEKFRTDPKYARVRRYLTDLKERESFRATWQPARVIELYSAISAQRR